MEKNIYNTQLIDKHIVQQLIRAARMNKIKFQNYTPRATTILQQQQQQLKILFYYATNLIRHRGGQWKIHFRSL